MKGRPHFLHENDLGSDSDIHELIRAVRYEVFIATNDAPEKNQRENEFTAEGANA